MKYQQLLIMMKNAGGLFWIENTEMIRANSDNLTLPSDDPMKKLVHKKISTATRVAVGLNKTAGIKSNNEVASLRDSEWVVKAR